MDKRQVKLKSSLLPLKINHSNKRKFTKNSARTPKHIDSLYQNKSVNLSKFKTVHTRSQKAEMRSINRADTNPFNDNEAENYKKNCCTNQTQIDLPHSRSEKTIVNSKVEQKVKSHNKSIKTSKKNQNKIATKFETGALQLIQKNLTTRKGSIKKYGLQNILLKTQKILQFYQKRQQAWRKEKQNLISQVQKLKRKDSSKKLCTFSATSTSKKYLY